MTAQEYIAKLLGFSTLPMESSGQGAFGAYNSPITREEWAELAPLLGDTAPMDDPMRRMMPLGGTPGGYTVGPSPIGLYFGGGGPNYNLSYFPNMSGTQTAMDQASAANDRENNMWAAVVGSLGGMAALGPLVAGAAGTGGTGAGAVSAGELAPLTGPATGSLAPATAGVSSITPVVSAGAPTLLEDGAMLGGLSQLSTLSNISSVARAMGLTKPDGSVDMASMAKLGLLGAGAAGAAGAIGGDTVGGQTNDWIGAAKATADANMANVLASSKLNHPNQITPQGQVSWQYDPATGQWTSAQTLAGNEQALYDASTQASLAKSQALMGLLSNPSITGGMDLSGLPKAPINAGTTAYDAIMSRLKPQLTRDEEAMRTRLANSGFDPGSAGFAEQSRLFGQDRNDLYLQAAAQGIGLDTTARQNAFNEQVTASRAPVQNLAALLGASGGGYQMPSFGQTWTPAGATPGADLIGATQLQATQQLGNQNLATSQRNANLSGLYGLAGSALGSKGFWDFLNT